MSEHNLSKTKARALGLYSGGLDSILACLVLRRAGVEVEAVSFESPFFSADNARKSAAVNDIALTVVDVSRDHLDKVVRNPRYGYGSNMNPCIDCHAYMIKKAGGIIKERGMDFIFTGEVLGQRPMSQNRQALGNVARASGMADLLLRPLSAKLMPITPMEESGLVDRELLLDLNGRGRKPQMALAREFGLKDYPAPAGGCLLTEPGFSKRLKDLLEHNPLSGLQEIELLKVGRHLRLSASAKLVVGRNQSENLKMEALAPDHALRLITQGYPGPLGLYMGPTDGPDLPKAAAIVAGYGKAPLEEEVTVQADARRILVIPQHRRHAQDLLL
jgi:tRNA-specific 2-thiouridylase